jgi:hypothetical protein
MQTIPDVATAQFPPYRIASMTHQTVSKVLSADAQQILDVLTRRQFTHPHAPLREALQATVEELGCCPQAIATATQWLQVDPDKAIGRLRRTELTQLARSIHRFWGQSVRASA